MIEAKMWQFSADSTLNNTHQITPSCMSDCLEVLPHSFDIDAVIKALTELQKDDPGELIKDMKMVLNSALALADLTENINKKEEDR